MSFGLHLVLSIVWALITLVVFGFGVWGIIAAKPLLLPVACFALTAIFSVFIVNDVKTLFFNKNVSTTNKV